MVRRILQAPTIEKRRPGPTSAAVCLLAALLAAAAGCETSPSATDDERTRPRTFRLENGTDHAVHVHTLNCVTEPGWIDFPKKLPTCGFCRCADLQGGGQCPRCKCAADNRWTKVPAGESVSWEWSGVYYESVERWSGPTCYRRTVPAADKRLDVEFCWRPEASEPEARPGTDETCRTRTIRYGDSSEVVQVIR